MKLIKYVMNYQRLINTNEYKVASSLLEVRGTMLKNPVTQTVYYNYLGLFYNKKAMIILREKLNLGSRDIFEIEVLNEVKRNIHRLDGEEIELFTMYLTESKKAFRRALDNSEDDIMWDGFIKYNDARSTYFLHLTGHAGQLEDWQMLMNEAIVARGRLNFLIQDILETQTSTFLQEEFIYQEYLARLVNINILLMEEKDIPDTVGNIKYHNPHYSGLENDRFVKTPYIRTATNIKGYQEKIVKFIVEVEQID